LARRHRGHGIAGVLSNHEGYGALTAALLARELSLPGPDPAAVALAQHKYHCRAALARVLPEATPFQTGAIATGPTYAPRMGYPCFIKLLTSPPALRPEIPTAAAHEQAPRSRFGGLCCWRLYCVAHFTGATSVPRPDEQQYRNRRHDRSPSAGG